MPEKSITIIKLLGRGGNAGLIKSCVIMRNIFCLLGNTELQGMCVLPPEMLGARMSFFQKQNRQELKGKKGGKENKKKEERENRGQTKQMPHRSRCSSESFEKQPGEIP